MGPTDLQGRQLWAPRRARMSTYLLLSLSLALLDLVLLSSLFLSSLLLLFWISLLSYINSSFPSHHTRYLTDRQAPRNALSTDLVFQDKMMNFPKNFVNYFNRIVWSWDSLKEDLLAHNFLIRINNMCGIIRIFI